MMEIMMETKSLMTTWWVRKMGRMREDLVTMKLSIQVQAVVMKVKVKPAAVVAAKATATATATATVHQSS